ncbi:MAG: PKD domain-containing protein [Acidobacteria bacterium]|nr:PKD domain-containing protein [Acidobacteriota bacterium]
MSFNLNDYAFSMPAAPESPSRPRKVWSISASRLLAVVALAVTAPMFAATCPTNGKPSFGAEPQLLVDATCEDPGFNERNFEIDKVTQSTLTAKGTGQQIPYTQVDGHFNPTQTQASLPTGVGSSPTTVRHGATWLFPAKQFWQNRFFEAVYPLAASQSYIGDPTFEFTHGGYIVNVRPGSPNVGYRVDAAAAKLAKAYANKLYGNSARIFGYVYGISGGSIQTMGAVESTTGVWDGAMPTSLATDGLSMHSFMWDSLLMMAIPQSQRDSIAEAVKPGSGKNIYEGLNAEQHAVLDEFLNAGFARRALEDSETFHFFLPFYTAGGLAEVDPTYEEDFWSKPGYEGANPPSFLSAAKVDAFATITRIDRDAQNLPTSIVLDPVTVPQMGSVGAEGLQFYVYAADGSTRTGGNLNGELKGSTLSLKGPNDPAMLNALVVGGKIRVNNRFLLALCFYPRHNIVANGNPAYKQYLNADGTSKYLQRTVEGWKLNSLGTQGGTLETGKIHFKTIIMENLLDNRSFPYTADFYHSQIVKALGPARAAQMVRIYYNDNAEHADLFEVKGNENSFTVAFGGIWLQALDDLVNWVEKGVAPAESTHYRVDDHNQVSAPRDASERGGLQPVVTLTVNGSDHAKVGANQQITLIGKIEAPPKMSKVVQYDWYLGDGPVKYEAPTVLQKPQPLVNVSRKVSFPKPGTYEVTLRATSQRSGVSDYWTNMQNLARVQIVVE